MDPISIVTSVLQMAAGVPAIGKVLAVVLGALVGVSAVVTALVAIWHAAVALVTAVATIPGLSGLAALAKSMQADSAVVDADSNQLLSWVERLSAIPVPQTAPPVTPPAAS
jgi:hypothetical protein